MTTISSDGVRRALSEADITDMQAVERQQRPVDFIANIIETLSLQNVTKDSVTVGLCASGIMGVKLEALKNAQAQQKKVIGALKCKPIISDRRKLESYVNKRWCSKITMLMNAA